MKKIGIHSILLIVFSFVSLIVFISGIKEIIVLNNFDAENKVESKISETVFLFKENILLLNSDRLISERVMNADTKTELENLVTEHEEKIKSISDLFLEISSGLNNVLFDQSDLIINLNNDTKTFFLKNYVPLFLKTTEQKINLLNFDIYYLEKLNSDNVESKNVYKNKLIEELNESQNQLIKASELTFIKLQASLQKTQLSLNRKKEEIKQNYIMAQNNAFVFFILNIIVLGISLVLLIRLLARPIHKIQDHLDIITKGELPDEITIQGGLEIKSIEEKINLTVAGLKRVVDFSSEIGKGNFEAEYKILSENDVLGTSLLTLRDNLQTAQEEEEKRKKEDAQRNRTNEGITRFGEILRQQSGNISELANVIISEMVKFMNANQGGLFFLNEDNKSNIHYELLGSYAYNRKKFLSKQIKPGEGLVGAVTLEKYTVYMTDVPDEYVEIESGVGSANPNSILIVPLKIDDNVLGVIELASFNEIEPFEIEMVEKIAETIASSLANARINMKTSALLEQSKNQAQLVKEQEDEIAHYIKEIKSLTKQVNRLTDEKESLKKTE